jgi:hypothetical protein
MRKKYLFVTAAVLLTTTAILSCRKQKSGFTNVPVAVLPTSSIMVNGVSELTVSNGDTAMLTVEIKLDSGKQEQIDLSLSGVPDGVYAVMSSSSGFPDFKTTISFAADKNLAAGTHTITLLAKSASGLSKAYPFKLNIAPPSECAKNKEGLYLVTQICAPDTFTTNIFITPSPSVKNRISITNFADRNLNVNANLNCATNTLSIPKQVAFGGFTSYTVTGSGTFTDSSFTITYKAESNFDTLECTDTYMIN